DVGGLGHEHRDDRQGDARGLVGGHAGAEHRLGVLADLVEGLGPLDAAGLAAAAGMVLGLDYPQVLTDGLRRIHGLLGGTGNEAGRNGDAGVAEQLLGLVFVEVPAATFAWERARARAGIVPDPPLKGKTALHLL